MKKNKKIIKNKYLGLTVAIVLTLFAVVGFNRIFGQSALTITSVCKTNGGILMDKANCPGDAPRYNLVASGTASVIGGNSIGSGYVRFIDGNQILTSDGNVWAYQDGENSEGVAANGTWSQVEKIHQLDTNIVNTISYWSQRSFVTKNGDFYVLREFSAINGQEAYDQWEKTTAFPTN